MDQEEETARRVTCLQQAIEGVKVGFSYQIYQPYNVLKSYNS